MQRKQTTTCAMVAPHPEDSQCNEALDAHLLHLAKGIPLPPGVEISAEILARFREGDDFFACKQCSYVGDRRHHARLHVLRIHVRQNKPIVGKRKYLLEEERIKRQSKGVGVTTVAAPSPVTEEDHVDREKVESVKDHVDHEKVESVKDHVDREKVESVKDHVNREKVESVKDSENKVVDPPRKEWPMPPESRCFFVGEWNRCSSKLVGTHIVQRKVCEEDHTSSSSLSPPSSSTRNSPEMESSSSSSDGICITTTDSDDEDCSAQNYREDDEEFSSSSYWDTV